MLELGKGLSRGEKLNLSKSGDGTLKKIKIGLGWDANSNNGADFDPDVSILLMDPNDQTAKSENFYYYNNLVSKDGQQSQQPDGSWKVVIPGYVTHWGDNRTGAGEGDDESIDVDLSKVPSNLSLAVIAVTIFEAEQRKQNFGMMNNAYIRVLNSETNTEICKLELDFDATSLTGTIFGGLLCRNGEWFFNSPNQVETITGGLQGVIDKFNIK